MSDYNGEMLYKHYLDQPKEIALETLSFCNAACTFCPYPTLDRKGTKMPDELIERLIDEMGRFKKPFNLSPFKVNEPLLDKRFIPICQLANDVAPKARLRIFTNGSALTEDNIRQIAGLSNIRHLWISLNSHIPEEYEKLMSLKFEKTAARLDMLHRLDFPWEVVLSAVGHPNEPFRQYCFDRWPKFQSMALERTSWLGYTDAPEREIPDNYCSRWFELSIMANGIVSLCCQDGEGKYPIGDVNKQTLLEVYNSPGWRDRREQMVSRRGISVCQTCDYK